MVVKVGLVGIGSMGGLHLKLLTTDSRLKELAKVTAVCDVREEALKLAKSLGVDGLFSSYDLMLREADLDAVIIATPPYLHREQAIKALKEGLYVLVEKPMGVTLGDAEEIAKYAGNKVMVAFSLRYHGLYELVKEYLSKELGDVITQWHIALGKVPPNEWIRKPELSGGMINENTIHVIYVMYWYAGKVEEVYAKTWRVREDVEIEDNALITMKHEGGSASTIIHSWSASHRWRKWGIQARYGTVTCEGYLGGSYRISKGGNILKEGNYDEPIEEMYVKQLKHFIECVKEGGKPLTNEEDGIHVHKIIHAIYTSAKQGKPIRIT